MIVRVKVNQERRGLRVGDGGFDDICVDAFDGDCCATQDNISSLSKTSIV
jgi:hypothetical protein